MKRPPGICLLLSAGLLFFTFQDVLAVRATSLIFAKTTTTTTTQSSIEEDSEITGETTTENTNSTTPKLTGIPQIDYIYDPNLPQELNGYNLSEYPFYERVPDEEFDFKCDGLHDGFYASVPHKCQVYHHCLFGTRYDFLCANYTAFDQKTFICHFVSEVDCINSPKFWHRNDALYQAASTTTPKPVYTPPPSPPPAIAAPYVPVAEARPRPYAPPAGRRRRPFRRKRPQYEYYDDEEEYLDDDYYEEQPRRDRRKKRPRPRPVYDDDLDDYEDDRYERRGSGRRDEDRDRRPYDRRGNDDRRDSDSRRGNGDRRPNDDRNANEDRRINDDARPKDDRRVNDDRSESEDRPYDRRRNKGNRRPYYDDEGEDEIPSDTKPKYGNDRKSEGKLNEDRKYAENNRKVEDRKKFDDRDEEKSDDIDKTRKNEGRNSYNRRKPSEKGFNRDESFEDRNTDSRPSNRNSSKRRPANDDKIPNDRPRKGSRRPVEDNYEYEERRSFDRRKNEDDNRKPEDVGVVKPSSGSSVYDRPRLPPKIRPPVPKNEANKYSYKTTKVTPKPVVEEEYYDEYEEDSVRQMDRRQINKKPSKSSNQEETQKSSEVKATKQTSDDDSVPSSSKYVEGNRDKKAGIGIRKRPVTEEYYEDIEDNSKLSVSMANNKKSQNRNPDNSESSTIKSTGIPAKEQNKNRSEPVVRVVKRPFLPSRGGSPYLPRGLQPVGSKNTAPDVSQSVPSSEAEEEEKEASITQKKISSPNISPVHQYMDRIPTKTMEKVKPASNVHVDVSKENQFKPSPLVVQPQRFPAFSEDEEEFKPVSNRPIVKQILKIKEYTEIRTTPRPTEKNTLDINENEYDVTLNDALNPTIPNLPVRGYPSGFSTPTEYVFTRPRYVVDPIVNQASDITYRVKQPVRYQDTRSDYSLVPRQQNSNQFGQVYYRNSPQFTQANSQAFHINN